MTDAVLPKAEGVPYTEFPTALHQRFLFDRHLGIGSRKGDSFAPARGKSIAVDPFFRLRGLDPASVLQPKRLST